MAKIILTIDCDFVFNDLLDLLNDDVYSSTPSMRGFMKFLDNTNRMKAYSKYFKPNQDRVDFVNEIVSRHIARKKPLASFSFINEHHHIIKEIDLKNDIVYNIDYHEDLDDDYNQVFCGNWANYVTNYEWQEFDKSLIDIHFDKIIFCYSPEWTPSVSWIKDSYVRNKLVEFEKI